MCAKDGLNRIISDDVFQNFCPCCATCLRVQAAIDKHPAGIVFQQVKIDMIEREKTAAGAASTPERTSRSVPSSGCLSPSR